MVKSVTVPARASNVDFFCPSDDDDGSAKFGSGEGRAVCAQRSCPSHFCDSALSVKSMFEWLAALRRVSV